MAFERVASEVVWRGRIATVRIDRFRHDDTGEVVEREVVAHPGAVAVLAVDGGTIYLVRQPREAVGAQSLLELPAGKLDGPDRDPLRTAQRELAEEIGKGARRWKRLASFYTSPGFADEEVHLFYASELFDAEAESDEEERIEVVPWPLDDLDAAIAQCVDAKSLVGLLWLRREQLLAGS
ncbi:NUDIX hydrolase [Thermoleophilum album]|uniref:NUDIX hydrolase n=1 Tax=Thermoleophilum album TaxID=29539 RepID=UPI0019868858|nr:NUDIX hydrolase [Thermoleophilum album]MCL6439972.1 NUDIX hydrolase [Thermoleophilum sp.]WDT92866.1 NUDIX hydrolase [Thermoleophilum album]